jgi:DnaJ-domain-containing protein 1
MRTILIGIIVLLIILAFRILSAVIAGGRKRVGETTKGGKGPERIEQCFEILGLKAGASQEELTQAYRDLVNVWHPDRFVDNQRLQKKAENKLKEINGAYDYIRSFYRWK